MAIVTVNDSDMKVTYDAIGELKAFFASMSDKKGRSIKYCIKTYGCQLNESDSEKLAGMLDSMGLESVSEDQTADLIMLNTCAVRENAEDRLFGNLGMFKANKKQNKDTIIIVCGCMMKVKENVSKIQKSFPYVDLVFDPQQLHLFPILLRDSLRSKKQLVNIGSEDYIADDSLIPVTRQRKFRALVPIMYGCNNFCTYCIVPIARGRERSRDFDSIVEELKTLAAQGYKEVMLLGQNVNSYGNMNDDGKRFPDILRAAANIPGFESIRFMSSHPKDLSDEVIEIMAQYDNVETHLHLPVQSGSDRLLKEMNRPYTIEEYKRIVDLFRSKVPDGAISTDIIVGFPGETEEDFEDTLKIVEYTKFDSAFTFQYSIRPGTKAATMENQVPHDVVTERFGRLLELQNDLAYKSNLAKVGKTEKVLVEGLSSTADNIYTGRTSSNHLINFTIPEELMIDDKKSENYEGKIGMVKFTSARPYSVDGVLESWK